MAAALFTAHAGRRQAAPEVSSAGVDAGLPSMPTTVPDEVEAVMAPYGLDLHDHRSRALTATALVHSDLVIAMTRRQVQESVLLDPGCFTRAFTLKELVRRGTGVGARPPEQDLAAWIVEAHGDRTRPDLGRRSTAEDITDPYGGPLAGYRATADELDGLTGRLADLLWPRADP
jgi:protein-tyrosine-phosphatase